MNSEQLISEQTAGYARVAREEKMDGNGSIPTNLDSLSQLLAQALQQTNLQSPILRQAQDSSNQPFDRNSPPQGSVIISGTGLGLPGAEKSVMDPENALRILRGEQFVDLIPERFRKRMVDKRITRLVKGEDGSGKFVTIDETAEVIKLAGRPGYFDLEAEYGVDSKLIEALDITTQLAMAAGLDALREAGIPLAQRYKTATTGKVLPQDWKLPRSLRDETGVIFASAFPGGDRFAEEFSRYYAFINRVEQLEMLEELRQSTNDNQIRRWNSTGVSVNCAMRWNGNRTRLTAAFCSAFWRWVTVSLRSISAHAGRTRRLMRRVRLRRRVWRLRKIGFVTAVAGELSSLAQIM